MNNAAKSALVVALTCTIVLLSARGAKGQTNPEADAFTRWIGDLIPQRGAVHAVYDAVQTDQVLIVGYDAQSGACYKAFLGKIFGRDVSSMGFGTRVPNGAVEVWENAPAPSVSDTAVEDAFPFVVLRDIAERAASSDAILPRNDGGWAIRFEFPKGMREFQPGWFPAGTDETVKPVVYEIDSRGRVVAIDRPGWGKRVNFSYDDRSPSTLAVATSLQDGAWTLREVTFEPRATSSAFHPNAVVERARAFGAYGVGFRAVIDDRTEARVGGEPVVPTSAPPHHRKVHVPMLVTGVAVVLAGVYAWLRRQ